MKFTTASGSVYEVNTDSKQIRRLNGDKDPTPRQGPDGQWRAYEEIFPDPPTVGRPLVIRWDSKTDLTNEGKAFLEAVPTGFVLPLTTTSMIVNIET